MSLVISADLQRLSAQSISPVLWSSTTSFTIVAKVKVTSAVWADFFGITDTGDEGYNNLILRAASGTDYDHSLLLQGNDQRMQTAGAVTANTWQTIGVTVTAGVARIAYRNGVATQTVSGSQLGWEFGQGLDAIWIGYFFPSSSYGQHSGRFKIAHCAAWKTGLSAAQHAALHNGGTAGAGVNPTSVAAADLVFYVPLTGDGTVTTPGGLSLTATGSPTYDSGDNPAVDPPATVLSTPTTVSTGNTIATVRVTTDTAPSGSSTLAVQVLPAADAVPAASAILASPTQTITSGASGARDFNLTSLTNGTAYRAHFAQTGPSNVVSTTSFTPSTVPGAPTIGTAVAGNAQATVNGTAPASNGGAAITGYRSTATPGGSTVTGASLPITHTGLTNGTSYTFTLAAQNTRGYGAESAASNSVTPSGGPSPPPPPPPPPPPSGPTLPAVATDATGSSKRLNQTTRMVVEPFTNIESLGTGTRTIVTGTTDAVTGQITLTGLSPGTYAVYGFFPSTGTSLAGVRFRLITIT